MKKCIIIGKTNVGKTVFALQFARYVGVERLTVAFQDPDGKAWSRAYTAQDALAALVSPDPHQTRCLQAICLELPVAKGLKRFEIIDTSGLIEGIHTEPAIRRAMAQTLSLVRTADLILHIVDASRAGVQGAVEAIGEVDYQVAQFAQM
ncbi:MAG TPA: GTPase domain-containing protein, partial [Limnochordia bacterium]